MNPAHTRKHRAHRSAERIAAGRGAFSGRVANFDGARLQKLGAAGFPALLWHQGENDADTRMPARDYADALAGIRAAQRQLWQRRIALAGPDTDTLTGRMRDLEGQGIHFSKEGLKAHGELWAAKVGRWLDRTLEVKS